MKNIAISFVILMSLFSFQALSAPPKASDVNFLCTGPAGAHLKTVHGRVSLGQRKDHTTQVAGNINVLLFNSRHGYSLSGDFTQLSTGTEFMVLNNNKNVQLFTHFNDSEYLAKSYIIIGKTKFPLSCQITQ